MSGWKDLEDFLRLHFGNQPEPYASHILFSVRKSCNGYIQREKFLNTRSLRDNTPGDESRDKYLDRILHRAVTRFDHYITPNGFKKYNSREKKNLQSIHNLVLDFDCHIRSVTKYMAKENYQYLCDAVLYWIIHEAAYDSPLVLPNTLVFTGRGIQMWYALEPVAAGLSGLCKAVINYLLEKWQAFFDGYNVLENLKADYHASTNINGLMRLPGTWNTHTHEYGSFEILRRDVLDIHDIMAAIDMPSFINTNDTIKSWKKNPQKAPKDGKRITTEKGKGKKTGTEKRRNGAQARVRGLWKLAEIRVQSGAYIGQRDLLCFFTFLAYKWAGRSNEECLKEARRMNDVFPVPLGHRELETYMSSATRKGYYYRNRKIIEELQITREEQMLTGIYSMTARERASTISRARKKERDDCIIRLLNEGNLSKREIAREAGCCVKTVYNVISRYVKSMEEQQKPADTETTANEVVVMDTAVDITGDYIVKSWLCMPVLPCPDGFPDLPAGPGG